MPETLLWQKGMEDTDRTIGFYTATKVVSIVLTNVLSKGQEKKSSMEFFVEGSSTVVMFKEKMCVYNNLFGHMDS